jgi:site-specific DNA-methyltransferase (adenine-specific)
MNALYFGDNLDVLRESIKDESVDLIYLDPPFNSNATYNVLFKTPKGHQSEAQIEAFDDTWHWGPHAEAAFTDVMTQGNTDVAEVLRALRSVLGENDMMAYLAMMTVRLIELHRVLKPTGSLYLHCDPTASHYLKIVLDQVFGAENFRNEIVWRRTGSHNARRSYGPIHDTILFYSKGNEYTFNIVRRPYMLGHVERRYIRDVSGRLKFNTGGNILTGAGSTGGESGATWKGFDPGAKGRHWAIPGYLAEQMPATFEGLGVIAKLNALYEKGLIEIKTGAAWPTPVKYLEQGDGSPIQDIWAAQPYTEGTVYGGYNEKGEPYASDEVIDADVAWLGPTDPERLGYPTQKPQGLLERIIASSSNEGDLVLDPFCGCGTAVHAAQALRRNWIGIDITHLAVSLIEKRMRDAFPAIKFEVHGTPKDLDGARDLAIRDKYQFQWWACSLVNAQPYQGKKKGADTGIDGLIYFQDDDKVPKKIVVSVKGGENVSVAMVRDFAHVIDREKAAIGLFVTLTDPTKNMVTEGVGEGYYTSPLSGAKFPKLQVLTIAGLLSGQEQAKYPRMDAGGLTFKRAKRDTGGHQDDLF